MLEDDDIDDSEETDNEDVIEEMPEDDAKEVLLEIAVLIDGTEWDSDTIDAIAAALRKRGITVKEPR